jgi:hypothetical protein
MLASVVIKIEYRRKLHRTQEASPKSSSASPAGLESPASARSTSPQTAPTSSDGIRPPCEFRSPRRPAPASRLESFEATFPASARPSKSSLPNGFSNRLFWPTNRSYRKQTIKPCLTGSRTAFKTFRFSRDFSAQPFAPATKSPTRSRPYGRS